MAVCIKRAARSVVGWGGVGGAEFPCPVYLFKRWPDASMGLLLSTVQHQAPLSTACIDLSPPALEWLCCHVNTAGLEGSSAAAALIMMLSD